MDHFHHLLPPNKLSVHSILLQSINQLLYCSKLPSLNYKTLLNTPWLANSYTAASKPTECIIKKSSQVSAKDRVFAHDVLTEYVNLHQLYIKKKVKLQFRQDKLILTKLELKSSIVSQTRQNHKSIKTNFYCIS